MEVRRWFLFDSCLLAFAGDVRPPFDWSLRCLSPFES